MNLQADSNNGSRKFGWPKSPAVLFGIAAAFFVVMGSVFVSTKLLGNRLPMMRHGQIVHLPAGDLVIWVAAPFAIISVIYAVIELGTTRTFQESATRLHFVCTLFGVVEAIFVYWGWANTTGNMRPDTLTWRSFGGAYAFAGLAGVAFVWNLLTSKPKPKPRDKALTPVVRRP
ncbi:MAG TPA: hypothetical protein VKB26_11035 [Candidatus Acidoferrales bacterium]|nr:hypothetical protein [Candidatus Acidoferrales bacterium]